ncbi:GntR family transcriptional regulator [Euzebya sp.]|uniref:GntR family transcriptional regulator n=1 Tax=Euzebya sp. TaxID=1971409 RepID=UPI00351319AB
MEQSQARKVAGSSAYGQLADLLRDKIVAGQLTAGAKLPSERELCAEHGLARGTVRQALNHLREEGLVVIQHGRGAFVRATPKQIPVPVDGPSGPPAVIVAAITDAGLPATARPMGLGPEAFDDTVRTGVIVFADAEPVATWQAAIRTPGPARHDPERGIHAAFPPSPPGPRTTTRARLVTRDEQRLFRLPATTTVLEVETTYDSAGTAVQHTAVYLADRIALTTGPTKASDDASA